MATTLRQWQLAMATGGLRIGIGSSFIVTRGFASSVLGADREDSVVPAALAAFGARDIALGLATIASSRPGATVAKPLKVAVGNDVLDAAVVAGLVQAGRLPKGRGYAVVGFSLLVAVADFMLARHSRRE